MAFLRRLFGEKKKVEVKPIQGVGFSQSQDEQDKTRERMESEMASQQEQRAEKSSADSTDKPPAANA